MITISTIAFNGRSIVWVQAQSGPQFGGGLSPLQNCSGGISYGWDRGGAGGNVNDIPSTNDDIWSPLGATN